MGPPVSAEDLIFFEGSRGAAQSIDIRRGDSIVAERWAQAGREADVLARCRQGDASAWRDLYAAHFDFVYRAAWRLGADTAEVEDICQEVFVVAFRKLSSFVEGRFASWLYRIVANLVAYRHRQRRFREMLRNLWRHEPETRDDLQPDRVVEGLEQKAVVDAVLRRMSARKREVLVLFELEGLPGEQVAELCGCKLETVWSRLHYARRDFGRILNKLGYTR
jgi:RNA polymerase sigma-70 factor, ECF subfamily